MLFNIVRENGFGGKETKETAKGYGACWLTVSHYVSEPEATFTPTQKLSWKD